MPVGRQESVLPRRWDRRRAFVVLTAGVLVASVPIVASGSASGIQRAAVSAASSEGYWSSVSQAGGAGSYTYGFSVAVTSTGSSVIAGRFSRTAYFPTSADDSIALTSLGGDEAFVAELNADGSYFLWAQRAGGTGNDAANSVAVTQDGTLIVTGRFSGTANFPTSAYESIAITSQGADNVFVAAMNADDSYFDWVQSAGSTGFGEGSSVKLSRDDTPMITGSFSGTAYFPTSANDSIALTARGSSDVFVASLNADDSYFAWAQQAGGAGFDFGSSVALTQVDGSPIITGYFSGTAYFPTSANDSIALTARGSSDVFVAALNADDSYFAWAQRVSSSSYSEGYSVAVNRDGTPLITGAFRGTAYFSTSADDSIALTSPPDKGSLFVAALNADDSYFAWAQQAGGALGGAGRSVVVTGDGAPIVAGSFLGTAYFPTSADDSIALTSSANGQDAFVAGLNADDSYFAWVQRAGGTGIDSAASVALTGDDTPIITGWFEGTAYFPTSADVSMARTASGLNDLFVGFLGGIGPGPGPGPDPGPDPGPGPGPIPAPVTPPSAPRDVVGVAGDSSALIGWSAPLSSGSFPVTEYHVQSSPDGGSCLAVAPEVGCTVTGLSNGSTYTFTVRARNEAGWGAASGPSNPVTPRAEVTPSIVITGSRDDRNTRYVRVAGTTTGLVGLDVAPWTRFPGEGQFRVGMARPVVAGDGTFVWTRRTGKAFSVYFSHGAVASNIVAIKPR